MCMYHIDTIFMYTYVEIPFHVWSFFRLSHCLMMMMMGSICCKGKLGNGWSWVLRNRKNLCNIGLQLNHFNVHDIMWWTIFFFTTSSLPPNISSLKNQAIASLTVLFHFTWMKNSRTVKYQKRLMMKRKLFIFIW